jgi:hypothetical protein
MLGKYGVLTDLQGAPKFWGRTENEVLITSLHLKVGRCVGPNTVTQTKGFSISRNEDETCLEKLNAATETTYQKEDSVWKNWH